MIRPHITEYLDRKGVAWEHHAHAPRISAQQIAAVGHVTGKRFAKTVVVEAGDDFVLAVLPADRAIDLDRLAAELGDEVRLADEARFGLLFRDCELGAMPPLGELYGMKVLVDESLTGQPRIVFNAGTHDETVEMTWDAFADLYPVKVLTFARPLQRARKRAA